MHRPVRFACELIGSDTAGPALAPGGYGGHLGDRGVAPEHHSPARGSECLLGKRSRPSAHHRGRSTRGRRGSRRATRSATIRPTAIAAWIGLVLFWTGIALRLWSFHTLGRYFTFTVQTSRDQPVIVDGPYRLIRHPSYAGLLLVIMAVGLFIGNWWSLVWLTGTIASRARVSHPSRGARTHQEPRRPLSQLCGNAQTARALHLVKRPPRNA